MLRKKFIIPMVAIMSVASSGSVFASEKPVNDNNTTVIYKNAEVTANSGLNIRQTPAIQNDNKISAVPKGTELGIVSKENDWYKVKLNNDKEAYINSNYVKLNNNDLYVNVDRLNFREGPGMDKKIYTVLTKGTKVEFLEENGNWIKVKVNNTTGYVHSKYITNEKPVVKTETTTSKDKSESSSSSVKPSKDKDTTSKKEQSNKEDKKENDDSKNSSKNESDKKDKTEYKKPTQNKPSVDKGESNKTEPNKTESNKTESKPSTNKPSTSKPSSKPESSKPSEKPESSKPESSKDVQAVIDLAYAQIGKPYSWGAEGPGSFDCSGLMRYIFEKGSGVSLPRTSKAQSQYGTTVSRANLKPGDIIFSSTDGSGSVSHVGIYVGGGQMIHAPKPGDVVKKSSINSSYWNDAYLWAKRVM